MSKDALTIEQALSLLKATPARIKEIIAELSAAQLRERPAQDEWSATEVLAHLRACADVRGEGINRTLSENKPTLRAMNPRTWMTKTDYVDLEFQPSFRAFSRQRSALLQVLSPLTHDQWSRSARIVGAGKPLEWSVLHYAEWLAIHERPHIKQIAAIAERLRSS